MTIELHPLSGLACNIRCQYCYQYASRCVEVEQGPPRVISDEMIDQIVASLPPPGKAKDGSTRTWFTLFGGEPLMAPLATLERLFQRAADKGRTVGIQTNGTLLTAAHVELFARFKVCPGISIDGPGMLNDARWAGTLEATWQMTARTEAAIETLAAAGIPPGLIITLHAGNVGTDGVLATFRAWLARMAALGVRSFTLHPMERDAQAAHWMLPMDRLAEVLLSLWADPPPGASFPLFSEVLALQSGEDAEASCVWKTCDPWSTSGAVTYEPDGTQGSCVRVFKDGVRWLPAEPRAHERQLILAVTPQEEGGCKDCPYWVMCRGHCPGCSIDGDWRNRSEFCAVWKALFAEAERRLVAQGKVPISRDPQRAAFAARCAEIWAAGDRAGLARVVADVRAGVRAPPASVNGHGDVPHGDSHGDHWDSARGKAAGAPVDVARAAEWTENGFRTAAAMAAAHAPVVAVLTDVLRARPDATRVLDLGCGNGALLQSARREAAFFPMGYDTNRIAIAKAWQAMPSGRWVVGNLVWDDWTVERPDVLLLMPGRVLELPNDNRPWQFLAKIFTVPTIIVYAYADWIATTGGLAAMCARLGWPVEMKITGPDVEVGVLRADHP